MFSYIDQVDRIIWISYQIYLHVLTPYLGLTMVADRVDPRDIGSSDL